MKNRMKKILIASLAASLALTGCVGPFSEENPNSGIIVEEIVTPTDVPAEEKEALDIRVERRYRQSGQGGNVSANLQYCEVSLENEKYQSLKKAIEDWSAKSGQRMNQLYADLEADAKEAENLEDYYANYYIHQEVSVVRVDEGVVSLVDDTYSFFGGAHGGYYREGINFDVKTGQKLALMDVVTDYKNFSQEATERIISQLQQSEYAEMLFDDYIESVEALWKEGHEPEWYMDASGLVIFLQEYSVGPYVMGTVEIHLPYIEFRNYIREQYLPGVKDGVISLDTNQEIYLSLAGSEEAVPMMLQYEWNEGMPETHLWLGNEKHTISDFASLDQAYLIRRGDEVFCLVQTDMASDDYYTCVYRLTEGVIQEIQPIYAAIDSGNINCHEVVMNSLVYLLGTYVGTKTYYLEEIKGFTTEDKEFQLLQNQYALTTMVDLPVTMEGKETVLPAGSKIVLKATDGETYVKFVIEGTDSMGELKVSRNPGEYYHILVNGIDEYECFEMLPYAG